MAATSQIPPLAAATLPKSKGGVIVAQSAKAHGKAPGKQAPPGKSRFGNIAEMGVPLAVLGVVLAMIAPLPAFLLDFIISANNTI